MPKMTGDTSFLNKTTNLQKYNNCKSKIQSYIVINLSTLWLKLLTNKQAVNKIILYQQVMNNKINKSETIKE